MYKRKERNRNPCLTCSRLSLSGVPQCHVNVKHQNRETQLYGLGSSERRSTARSTAVQSSKFEIRLNRSLSLRKRVPSAVDSRGASEVSANGGQVETDSPLSAAAGWRVSCQCSGGSSRHRNDTVRVFLGDCWLNRVNVLILKTPNSEHFFSKRCCCLIQLTSSFIVLFSF